MSDWDFLHDMREAGYSADQVSDAAALGYNPWEWAPVENDGSTPGRQPADPLLEAVFQDLVDAAREYRAHTGRFLQIWGELGELYAEVYYGVERHRPHAQGSDGRLGNHFVEVKTISPEKGHESVHVKRTGNFSKLLVVRISDQFEFEGRLLDRKAMSKGQGALAKVSWSTLDSSE